MDKSSELKIRTKPDLNGNYKKPKKLTLEEKRKNYENYLNFKSSYYKGQLCSFYLRGSCWLEIEKCQFAHGIKDLNIENYLSFSENHFKKQIKNSKEYANNIQKYYMIVSFRSKDYSQLYEYQVELKKNDKIKFFYSLDVVNQDARKRTEIRRILHREIFQEFCEFFFLKLFKDEIIAIEKFEKYYESLGFKYNFRKFSSLKLLNKTIIDKKTKVKKSIIKLMPTLEEMMTSFEEILISKLTEELTIETYDKIIPFSSQYISTIINKNIEFDKALVHHYCKVKGASASEFLDDLTIRPSFNKDLEDILKTLNIKIPERDKLIHIQNNDEVLSEFKETFWEKFKTFTSSKFGFLNFDFIKENYVQRYLNNKRLAFVENSLITKIKKLINSDKNLFFINNNNTISIFNLNEFDNFDIEELEENYEKRCEIIDNEAQKIFDLIFEDNDNEIIETLKQQNEFREELNFVDEEEILNIYKNKETVIVEDKFSVYYFMQRAQNFRVVALDLEGSLTKKAVIDLIQLTDNKQIFIVDYHKICVLNDDKFLQKMIKIVLTFLLENPKIQKIFHDGRNDCLAIHSVFQICTTNYIDLSNVFSGIKQFKLQIEYFNKYKEFQNENKSDYEHINMISYVGNCINPGLNKILEDYEPNHRVNHLKDKIHKMFGLEYNRQNYFLKRPLDEEWILYCELDVKYIIDTFGNMLKDLELILKKFYGKHLKHEELLLILRLMSIGHLKYSCEVMR